MPSDLPLQRCGEGMQGVVQITRLMMGLQANVIQMVESHVALHMAGAESALHTVNVLGAKILGTQVRS